MDDFWFFIIVWTIVGLSKLAIGYGSLKGGNILRPHGRFIRGLGYICLGDGIIDLGTVIYGVYTHNEGYSPVYLGIGQVAYLRTAKATLFWPIVAIIVNSAAFYAARVDEETRKMLLELHIRMWRLKKASNA